MNELNELKKLFDEPKERISYEDWYKNKYEKDCNYMIKNFPEYWKEECDHLYLAWEIRKISVLIPMYLKNIISLIRKCENVLDKKELIIYFSLLCALILQQGKITATRDISILLIYCFLFVNITLLIKKITPKQQIL